MGIRETMGKAGFTGAIAAAILMSATAFLAGAPVPLQGGSGLCLPSPDAWNILTPFSWALNLLLMLGIVGSVYILNKNYAFVPGNDMALPGLLAIMSMSCPWVACPLNSSTILLAANVACLSIVFSCFKQRNATQELFAIATILSLGSMVQYAFIFMIPAYIAIAAMLKCLHFKGAIAFILGLIAPYWVGIGLGIIPLTAFSLPAISGLFPGAEAPQSILAGLTACAVTALGALVAGLYNSVKLYAGNSQRRLYNVSINILGVLCAFCMVIDFGNMPAYIGTLYLAAAVQFANIFALHNVRRGSWWLAGICTLYAAAFVLTEIQFF